MRLLALLFVFSCLAILAGPGVAQEEEQEQQEQEANDHVASDATEDVRQVSDRLLVMYDDAEEDASTRAGTRDEVGTNRTDLSSINGSVVASGTHTLEDLIAEKERIEGLGGVKLVELDDVGGQAERTFNDPFLDPGSPNRSFYLWVDQAFDGWDWGLGAGVLVNVIDSGCRISHIELRNQVLWFFDFYEGDNIDYRNHGTPMASTIAGIANNSNQGAGIAPQARIMCSKVMHSGNGDLTNSNILLALDFGYQKGARVTNMSLSIPGSASSTVQASIDSLSQSGVVVNAFGNDCTSEKTSGYPQYYPNVIGTSGLNEDGAKSWYDAYGFTCWGNGVDISAPAHIVGPASATCDTCWGFWTGTSFAAPQVSAAAADYLSRFPSATGAQVRQALLVGAVDMGPTGWDNYYGHGRLSVLRTFWSPPPNIPPAPPPSPSPPPAPEPPPEPLPDPDPEPFKLPTESGPILYGY